MKKPKFFVAFLIFFLLSQFNLANANDMAPKHGPERIRQCQEQSNYDKIREGKDGSETLKINMNSSLTSNPEEGLGSDFMLEMSNPYCATYYKAYWLAFKIANNSAALACGGAPSISLNPIQDVLIYAKTSIAAKTKGALCSTGFFATTGLLGLAGVQAAITAETAQKTIRRVRVCGYNWSQPTYVDDAIDYENKGEINYQRYLATKNSKTNKEADELNNSGRYFKINDVMVQKNNNKD